MSYTKKYPERINWENYPSIDTPIDEINLNKMDYALREIDQTLYDMDSTIQEEIQDAEAWAKGTRDGSDVPSTDPAYHNNSKYYAEQAEEEAVDSQNSSYDSEAWAKGTRNGQAVPSTDPAYHNNAKYYSEQSDPTSFANMSDVNFTNLQNGQVPKYNSTTQMWENGEGGDAEAIPTYNIPIDATPTNDSPIIIPGVDFTQPFKLILSTTVSASTIDLGYIYISDGTTTNLYYAYYKRSDSTGVQSAATSTKIRYDTSGYVCCLEFLCFKNRQSAYVALCGTDDAVSMSSLADVTLTSLSNNDVLKYNSTTQKWENGTIATAIPMYSVQLSSATTSSSRITISDLDITKPFKLIITTNSTTSFSMNTIHITNGSTNRDFAIKGQCMLKSYGAQGEVTPSNILYSMDIFMCKRSSSTDNVCSDCLEFLCYASSGGGTYPIALVQGFYGDITDFNNLLTLYQSGSVSSSNSTVKIPVGDSGSSTVRSYPDTYLLFTYEHVQTDGTYRGHHIYYIYSRCCGANAIAPEGILVAGSTNSGYNISYIVEDQQPYVKLTRITSYMTFYKMFRVRVRS